MRWHLMIAVAFFCFHQCANGADKLANWDWATGSSTGNWSDASKWLITPDPIDPGTVPDNGNGGFTYNVDIDSGNVTLDVDAEIERLYVAGPDLYGQFTISNGRELITNQGALVGDSTVLGIIRRGTGTVNVFGTGSSWNNVGFLSLGAYGYGYLNIADGGTVSSTSSVNAGGKSSIGTNPPSGTGNISVIGQQSMLTTSGALTVGTSGFGNLVIKGGGNVVASTLNIGSRGSLHVDFGSTPPSMAPLVANGTATLASTLRVTLPYQPAAGEYQILDYQQLSGQFSSVAVEGLAPSEYSLNYGSGTNDSVTLVVAPKPKSASSIYWTDSQNGMIRRANLDGSAIETIATGIQFPRGIAVDPVAHQVYWGADTANVIQRAELNGSSIQNVTASNASGDIAVDHLGGKVYWTQPGVFPIIQRANLDGSNTETILNTGSSNVQGIALDIAGAKLYWTNYSSDSVYRANLDGSGQETLVSGQSNPMNIALDTANGRMYWSDNGFSQIRSANLDGSDIRTVVSGVSSSAFVDVELDGSGSMYWIQTDSSLSLARVMRANLDGTNIQTIVQTSNATFRGLAVFAYEPIPGDYNADSVVNAADYAVWRDTLGSTTNLAANGNGNTEIDAGDYEVWRENFGEALGSTSALPGDYNADGEVSAADYAVWRDTLGSTTNLAANGNGNTEIDAGDYEVWQENFGADIGGSSNAVESTSNVPEPATLQLLAVLAMLGSCRIVRARKRDGQDSPRSLILVLISCLSFGTILSDAAHGDILKSFVIETSPPPYTSPDVTLPNFACCSGDYNRDRATNAADYVLWRDTLGQTVAHGNGADGNWDGATGQEDYNAWKKRFGSVTYEDINVGQLTGLLTPFARNVHDTAGLAALKAYRDESWWRESMMTMSGNLGQEVATRGALHWNNGHNSFPEIISFFEDGGFRPHLAANKVPTGTVRFGPLEFDELRGRRYADVASIDMLIDAQTPNRLKVTYGNGEFALVVVEEVNPNDSEKTRFRVEVAYDSTSAEIPLFEITSMFVSESMSDAALIEAKDSLGQILPQTPILDFAGGSVTEVWLRRVEPSFHNSLGPDIRVGEFMFEDTNGGTYQGPLWVTNDSYLTDCAEEDNVILSFFAAEPNLAQNSGEATAVPEPATFSLTAMALLLASCMTLRSRE